jgi:hypothetical protein
MAASAISPYIDAFLESSFKFDLPVFGSKAASLAELGSKASLYCQGSV